MSWLDDARERIDLARHLARMARDVPKLLPSARVNPASLLRERVRRNPRDLALVWGDARYTWDELSARASQYANWLSGRGVGAGDVVALMMDNRPDFVFAVMGLSKLGAIGSLINTNLTGRALSHALRVCRPKKVLLGEEHVDAASEVLREQGLLPDLSLDRDVYVKLDDELAADRRPPAVGAVVDREIAAAAIHEPRTGYRPRGSDTYCYIYTSGTTGLPKAAIVTNQRMLGANVSFGHLMHRSGPGDVIYVTLPLYHSSAMFLGWGAALGTGAAMALRRKFSASAFWHDVRAYQATSFLYIGELCRYLLNRPLEPGEREHRLRVGVGNGMRPDIWLRFQERFNVPVIREFYGATEGNAPILNFEGRPGMVGRMRGNQVLVRCDPATGEVFRNAAGFCERVEPGESGLLLGRISKVLSFQGYVDEKATRQKIVENVFERGDRYFDSGDLLNLHEGGWLSFADRAGDTFRWKGENVSTNEVAEILDGAKGVQEANVYGVEVPGSEGRAGMAALRVDASFDLDGLAAYVDRNLARYQRPRFLRLLQGEMRVTTTFKHQKVAYREEGYDPGRTTDPLYFWREDRFERLDADLFARITRGEVAVG